MMHYLSRPLASKAREGMGRSELPSLEPAA
jgi:hypothetical protein